MISAPPTALSPALLRDLARDLGEGAVLSDADRLLVYESDGLTRYRQRPAAVVLPVDTEGCARAVARLHAEGIPVVPRGAGTGLSGGAVPEPGAVVIGTARMSRILALDPEARRARVQAGVVNADLVARAAAHGLSYAPDPSSQSACTIGGNVAENSGGPHCLKYGVTSRYVTALRVVGAGGTVLELGPAGGRDLDLLGLFVGSEGCFGLATEIEVALVPAAEAVRTLLAAFPRPEEAGAAVSAIIAAGLLPAALEIVDGSTIRAVEASVYAAGYPLDAGAALVVEFDGCEAGLDDDLERAEAFCRAAGATEIRRARDEAERAALWKGRKKAFGAMGRLAPDLMVQDATVPRSRLPEVLARVGEIAARHGLPVANVFHAGDGNLHPNLLFDSRDAGQVERVELASREIMEACVAAGGTITGEHGVGLDKRHYMHLVCGPGELDAMEGVRRAFDPDGLWNPGKVLPDREDGPAADLSGPPLGSGGDAADAGEAAAPQTADDLAGGRRRAGGGARGARMRASLLDDLRAEGGGVWDGEQVRAGASPLAPGWWRTRADAARPFVPLACPSDEAGLGRLMAGAAAAGLRVLVAGGGGALPCAVEPDLVVSPPRLARVVAHEPADLTVTADAGTPLAELQERLGAAGQRLSVDGPELERALLGSVVATADAVALATAYGAVRDQVLGLRVVTGDGRALRLGGAVVKNVAGFDLVRLLVGSRGTLGAITAVTLRTHPLAEADHTMVIEAADAVELLPAVAAVLAAPLIATSVELAARPGEARLLVRVAGSAAAVEHAVRVFDVRVARRSRLVDEARARELRAETRAWIGREEHVRRWVGTPSVRGLQDLLARAGCGGGAGGGTREVGSPGTHGAGGGGSEGGAAFRAWPDRGVVEVGGVPGQRVVGVGAERGAAAGGRSRPRTVVTDGGRGAGAAPHGEARGPQAHAAVRRITRRIRSVFDPGDTLVDGAEVGP